MIIPAQLGDNHKGQYAPVAGAYHDMVVLYQATGATYIFDSQGVFTQVYPDNYDELVATVEKLVADTAQLRVDLTTEETERKQDIIDVNQRIDTEVADLQRSIDDVATDLEEYKNSPDVRYIVDTHADLASITDAGDKDVARVLQDETHEGASTYYSYDLGSKSWTYIGQTGPYYTKEQIDEMIGDVEAALETLDTGEGV